MAECIMIRGLWLLGDAEQRLMMDLVTVEDVFYPMKGWLSSILTRPNRRKHRWVTESGTKLRWLGTGVWSGWHIDTRDGQQSLWFHENHELPEPPEKGWQFWHNGRYHQSKLWLVDVDKALPSMLCFKCDSRHEPHMPVPAAVEA
ncbi:unnamed protein product, partial [Symbiodinium sp. CCMP2592]